MWLLVNFKNDWIIILLKWISCWTKTFTDVTKIFHYMVDNKTLVLIFLLHTFSWWFWITLIKHCCYRFQYFYQSKPFITLSLLVIFAWKYLIHIYDELVGSQSFLLTNFIHIFQKCYSFGKEKTVVFFCFCKSSNYFHCIYDSANLFLFKE